MGNFVHPDVLRQSLLAIASAAKRLILINAGNGDVATAARRPLARMAVTPDATLIDEQGRLTIAAAEDVPVAFSEIATHVGLADQDDRLLCTVQCQPLQLIAGGTVTLSQWSIGIAGID